MRTRLLPDRHRGGGESVDLAALGEAIGQVVDPLLGQSLAELGLVGEVTGNGRGAVRVSVPALTGDTAHHRALHAAVVRAAAAVLDARPVDVDVVALDGPARAAVGQRLRSAHRRPGSLGTSTRVYAVASGKGGVGKSSLTANLAVALAQSGLRVGLLDADVWGYSMPQLFGISDPPVAVSGMMLPVGRYGVRVMSIGFLVGKNEAVIWRGPMLHKALEQFLDDVAWGPLDVFLIDLPPGTGDVPLTLAGLLPGAAVLVVTTPQKAAQDVAARMGALAIDAGLPLAGVVENMTGSVFGSGGGERLAGTLGTTLLGQVPMDEELCRAGDRGEPLLAGQPTSPAAVAIRQLAQALPRVQPSLVGRALPLFVS